MIYYRFFGLILGGIDLAAFAVKGQKGSIRRKISRLLTKGYWRINYLGYLLDVKVLEDLVKSNLGDITFEVLQILILGSL